MAGGNFKKPSPASSSHRNKGPKPKPSPHPHPHPGPKPSPHPGPSPRPDAAQSKLPPFPFPEPPPPPSYGFHMLDRRTAILADGSVRSYFALPPDYQDFPAFPRPRFPPFDRQLPMSPDFRGGPDHHRNPLPPAGGISIKRKYVDEERQRQQLLQYGHPNGGGGGGGGGAGPSTDFRAGKFMRLDERNERNGGRIRQGDVDQGALKKAFLHFVKLVFENGNQKKKYLDDGKQGVLRCLACQRSSKDVPDMHALVMHAYNPESADSLVDHLGFHKALCILMGWNFLMPPDISKLYQKLPAEQATANQEDLVLWPPLVIIHNTITGRGRDGRMEGLGNRTVDSKLRDIGVPSGKSKSLYSRDGHLGITLVKFSGDESGLKEAMRLAVHFEKDGHGRRGWAQVPSSSADKDDESNHHLVKVDPRTGEKNRILYGYLATVMDMDKVDFETRKKVTVESRRDHR